MSTQAPQVEETLDLSRPSGSRTTKNGVVSGFMILATALAIDPNLPRGWLHSATALGGVSAHLTVGIHAWTRRHVAGHLLDAALRLLEEDPAIRAALPFGRRAEDLTATEIEEARRAALDALAAVPAGDVRSAMAEAARRATRPRAVSPVASLLASGPADRS